MFEKSIRQLEPLFPVTWFLICLLYYSLVGQQTLNRFEFDIYAGIILFFVSLALGYKKITADNRGITKSPYLIPSLKKTKTWSEIKHMAHIALWRKGRYGGIYCNNVLCFIDFNDKVCFKIRDESRKSKYNKKTKSIETVTRKPSLNFSNFINLVKRKEDTYETELFMKYRLLLSFKIDYEKYKDPKIKIGFFS
tara:strand:+ start:330 stop:911 length:582 start_codon:yes stop_codon:yes gene_type:complete